MTGEGVADAVAGVDVVVDVANSPSWTDDDVMNFFTTSTRNLLEAERAAGVKHHVALSIVGTDRVPGSGYLRAKAAQEKLITESERRYSIVRATQFFEFALGIADSASDGDTVRLSHDAAIQPIAAKDVATAVTRAAIGEPLNGITNIAGPDKFGMDDLGARRTCRPRRSARGGDRPDCRIFRCRARRPQHRSLGRPDGEEVTIYETHFNDWAAAHLSSARLAEDSVRWN